MVFACVKKRHYDAHNRSHSNGHPSKYAPLLGEPLLLQVYMQSCTVQKGRTAVGNYSFHGTRHQPSPRSIRTRTHVPAYVRHAQAKTMQLSSIWRMVNHRTGGSTSTKELVCNAKAHDIHKRGLIVRVWSGTFFLLNKSGDYRYAAENFCA